MLPLTPDMTIEDRVALAIDRVQDLLLRATAVLEAAGVPYAVAGGNAVAEWVAKVNVAAVRFTQDVDILLRRADLDAAETALRREGFIRRKVRGIEIFMDGPDADMRNSVHVVIAGEKVHPESIAPSPDIVESEKPGKFRVVSLEALVRMKLTSYRRKDQVHLLDMLDVGLIDASWKTRFDPILAERLQHLIDTPDQ